MDIWKAVQKGGGKPRRVGNERVHGHPASDRTLDSRGAPVTGKVVRKGHLFSVLTPGYQSAGTRLRCGPLEAAAWHSGPWGSGRKTQGQSRDPSNGGDGRGGALGRRPVSRVLGHLGLAHSRGQASTLPLAPVSDPTPRHCIPALLK